MAEFASLTKRKLWIFLYGLLVGALIILGIRFTTYKTPHEDEVHYHANIAVYINGQQEKFAAPNYYEEEAVASCSATNETEETPMSRVHMHGNVNNVVHVEDTRVTWGNFFTVLGWNAGPRYLATRDAVYQVSGQDQLTYMLNGKKVDNIANTIIGDQDKLLINFGSESTNQIQQEYSGIKNNALAADRSNDPAACGADHTDSKPSFSDRLHHMF